VTSDGPPAEGAVTGATSLEGPWQPVHRGWRPIYLAFLVLTFVATVVLYVFSHDTDEVFAWTVLPAISAAFLGGGYAAGFVLVAGTAVERTWAAARTGVVTIFLFVLATLAVTVGHRDRFHFDRGGLAGAAAWFWLAVYVVVPIAMAVMFVVQRGVPGTDPPVRRPLPEALRALLAAQAVVLVLAGAILLAAPGRVADGWPWPLPPLTGRAVGAWCLPLGVAAALAAVERDAVRLRAAALTYVTLAALHAVALVRFRDDVRWDVWGTWVYLAVLASMAVAGVWGRLLAAGAADDVNPPVGAA
jgi:hypothetical protein